MRGSTLFLAAPVSALMQQPITHKQSSYELIHKANLFRQLQWENAGQDFTMFDPVADHPSLQTMSVGKFESLLLKFKIISNAKSLKPTC